MKKIFLFGSSGPTGKLVLNELLEKNFYVKALVRNPDSISNYKKGRGNEKLNIIKGDVFQTEFYFNEIKDSDCVISVLGTGKSVKPTNIYSVGGSYILKAIQDSEKRCAKKIKLITVTSGGVQEDDPVIQNNFFYKHFGLRYLRHIYRDAKNWEQILEINKDLDWVCVRPTYLQDLPKTGKYRVRHKYAPDNGWKISRADLAEFIVSQIENNEFIHKYPVLAN